MVNFISYWYLIELKSISKGTKSLITLFFNSGILGSLNKPKPVANLPNSKSINNK